MNDSPAKIVKPWIAMWIEIPDCNVLNLHRFEDYVESKEFQDFLELKTGVTGITRSGLLYGDHPPVEED